TKQNTCAGRTPANNAALKDFLRRAPLRSGLAIVRGSTTVLPKIFMVRRAHHDIKPNTCATRTPANNAALKGLAIAKGGTTVVPNIFSGEVMEECIVSTASMSSLRSVWTLLRSNCEAIIHANEKPTIMDNVSCPACPTTGGSGIEDGKVAGRVNKTLSTSMDHTSSSSTLFLLSTIFVLLNFGFISATHAQSQTHHSGSGAAEVVVMGEVLSAGDGRMMEGVTIRIKEARTLTDERGSFRIETDLQEGEIEASFVGYRSAIVRFDLNSKFVRIKLDPAYETIDEVEVVSTGYQRLPRERATGSFVYLDKRLINRTVGSNFLERMEGVVPGMNFNNQTYQSSLGQKDFSIRGTSTLFGQSQPLVVMDGFPYDGDL